MGTLMKYVAFSLLLFPISCENHSARYKVGNTLVPASVDTAYMRTGFYYLSESLDGIKMQKEHSNEIYSIARTPFASVDHIMKTEVNRQSYNGTNTIALCMTFDGQGTSDLQNGTGNSLHPKIAVIIANKLLYVVDNSSRIKTGIMCVLVDDYSEQEIAAMQKSITEKR